MKIVVDRRTFVKALSVGCSFVPKKAAMPILECVKIKVKGSDMYIISSDKENVISKHFGGVYNETGEDFTICVQASTLLSYVKLIKSEDVALIVEEKNLIVKHKRGKTSIPLDNADLYPQMKSEGEAVEFEVSADEFARFIADGCNFVGTDELRPVMGAMYVYRSDKGEIGYCCSDGRVLITDSYQSGNSGKYTDILVNRNVFKPLSELLESSEKVLVKKTDRNVLFKGEDTSIMAIGVEGRFPNFYSVIPKESSKEAKINKAELVDSIQRCKLSSSASLIVLSFDGTNLHIESQDLDFGLESSEDMSLTSYSGDNIKIGVNAEKILSCLGSIDTKEVIMKMTDGTRAILMFEDNESPKTILLMPMMM